MLRFGLPWWVSGWAENRALANIVRRLLSRIQRHMGRVHRDNDILALHERTTIWATL